MTARITQVRPVDANNQVVTVEGGSGAYRRQPCAGCPWKTENAGSFPAEAFRHSANTAHDMSTHTFGCHESGNVKPATCAGFLLRGAAHNLTVRMRQRAENFYATVSDGGHELHASYRAMAIANGVPAGDPAIAECRE
jgi:hypothetical protein